MPIRLTVLLATVLTAFLYLTFYNSTSINFTLYPGHSFETPVSVPMLASFFTGVVSVFILYLYDAVAESFGVMKRNAIRKRDRRARELYEDGQDRLNTGDRRGAEKLFLKTLAHNPGHVPAMISLGAIKREDGDIEEAVRLHSMARAAASDNVTALMELAQDYTASGQSYAALALLREARIKAGRAIAPLERIRELLLKAGDIQGALEAQKDIAALSTSDKAVEERSMLAALMYESALASENKGLLEEAKEGLKGALLNDGGFIPAYLKLSGLQEFTGDHKEMARTLEKGYKATRSVILLKALVDALTEAGEGDKAAGMIGWGLESSPAEDILRLFLADVHMRSGKFPEARREMEKLEGKYADTAIYHLIEGKIRAGERNVDWAVKSLDEAYKMESESLFHFSCSSCGHVAVQYEGKCPKCGGWNTLSAVMY
ncbi:MAG: hypothetical protein HZB29_02230 [Nitrospinae bacterium]|nr:hypothetical protein [Nitrospinota bacterium]